MDSLRHACVVLSGSGDVPPGRVLRVRRPPFGGVSDDDCPQATVPLAPATCDYFAIVVRFACDFGVLRDSHVERPPGSVPRSCPDPCGVVGEFGAVGVGRTRRDPVGARHAMRGAGSFLTHDATHPLSPEDHVTYRSWNWVSIPSDSARLVTTACHA